MTVSDFPPARPSARPRRDPGREQVMATLIGMIVENSRQVSLLTRVVDRLEAQQARLARQDRPANAGRGKRRAASPV
jgi:hypothetical protein